ncbi:sulfatase [Flammeovirgaceae bacterium SG7u.111]|nr:sulfatase [Flammeovirgaceae bacterium SG7u.132]WPO37397.1 sulfatase [Flammeovirgaceae bacterium SG7u.111]
MSKTFQIPYELTMKFTLPLLLILLYLSACNSTKEEAQTEEKRPNILFAISDDQSFAHTSFAGAKFVNTPAFDRIANEGIYFKNCIAGSPGCAPSRSAIVTGRYPWQNEQSGQHASSWMKKHVPFIDLLDANGYKTGRTGKGVGPFYFDKNGENPTWRASDPGGKLHSNITYGKDNDERTGGGISSKNYFANFKFFLDSVVTDEPFFFWYGGHEPHLPYEQYSWKKNQKQLESAEVPGFLPDVDVAQGDLLDYAVEIEWFDLHLMRMLDYLEEIGELDNTIVIVTADNGMPFPRAKANGYEYGIHVPFAVRYPKSFPGKRVVGDVIDFTDIAPTILEMTGTSPEGMMAISGKSIRDILESDKEGMVHESNKYAFSGRERHSSSRYQNWGYPQRMIRSEDYLLVWNAKPDRWPAGAPQRIKPETKGELLPMYGIDDDGKFHSDWAYTDIDAIPTKSFIVENRENPKFKKYFGWATAKRQEFELFDIKKDPYCITDLSGDENLAVVEKELKKALFAKLTETQDPRVVGPDKEIFDSYIRYSRMREFPKPE